MQCESTLCCFIYVEYNSHLQAGETGRIIRQLVKMFFHIISFSKGLEKGLFVPWGGLEVHLPQCTLQ